MRRCRDPGAQVVLLKVWAVGAPRAALAGLAYGAVTYPHDRGAHFAHARAWVVRRVGPNGLGITLLLGGLLALGFAVGTRGREWVLRLAAGLFTLG